MESSMPMKSMNLRTNQASQVERFFRYMEASYSNHCFECLFYSVRSSISAHCTRWRMLTHLRRSECVACNGSNLDDYRVHKVWVISSNLSTTFQYNIFQYISIAFNNKRLFEAGSIGKMDATESWSSLKRCSNFSSSKTPRYADSLLDACVNAVHWCLHGPCPLHLLGRLVELSGRPQGFSTTMKYDEPLFDPQRTLELSKKSTQIALNVYWVIRVLSFTHAKSSTVQSAFRCTHSWIAFVCASQPAFSQKPVGWCQDRSRNIPERCFESSINM